MVFIDRKVPRGQECGVEKNPIPGMTMPFYQWKNENIPEVLPANLHLHLIDQNIINQNWVTCLSLTAKESGKEIVWQMLME